MKRVLAGVALLFVVAACSDTPIQPPTTTVSKPQFTTRVGDAATWYFEATVYWATLPGINIGDRITGTVDFEILTSDMYSDPRWSLRISRVTWNYTVNGVQQPVIFAPYGNAVANTTPYYWTPSLQLNGGYPFYIQMDIWKPLNDEDFPIDPPALNSVLNTISFSDYSQGGKYFRARFTVLNAVNVRPGDTTPPVITPVITGAPGNNGWYISDVTVAWDVTDLESPITSPPCATTVITWDTDATARSCEARSTGGTNFSIITIKRDATPPVIEFTYNFGTYLVDQYLSIDCHAWDARSGISSGTCPFAFGPAYSFGAGEHTLEARVEDRAGNVSTASTTFNVIVDERSLSSLIDQWVTQRGVANSLKVKLQQKDATSFANEIRAQAGKFVPADKADILIGLAAALFKN